MIKIGIVFDEIYNYAWVIEKSVKKCSCYNEKEFKFKNFTCWNDFYLCLQKGETFDIIFLDVEIKESLYSTETSRIIYAFIEPLLIYLYSIDEYKYELSMTKKFATIEIPFNALLYNSTFDKIISDACSYISVHVSE